MAKKSMKLADKMNLHSKGVFNLLTTQQFNKSDETAAKGPRDFDRSFRLGCKRLLRIAPQKNKTYTLPETSIAPENEWLED